jgi:hypothetical protein
MFGENGIRELVDIPQQVKFATMVPNGRPSDRS